MTPQYTTPWNSDVAVQTNPRELWYRVVVLGESPIMPSTTARWAQAAAVGPLQPGALALTGLLFSLAKNPQIRVVVWDGGRGETEDRIANLWDAMNRNGADTKAVLRKYLPGLWQKEYAELDGLFDFHTGIRLLPAEEWQLAVSLGMQWAYMTGGDRPRLPASGDKT